MSLVGLAIRLSAVRALTAAQTVAGTRIFDSALLPMDRLISDDPAPFVIVSTDTETMRPTGRDVCNGDGDLDLIFEVALAKASRVPATGDDEERIEVDLFDADASLEICLAVLRRQIMGTLFGAGGGAWGDVFRAFVKAVPQITTVRAAQSKNGTRFAGRQIIVTVRALAEPNFAPVESGTPWEKLLSALEGDAALDPLANVIRTAIEVKPIDWPTVYTASAFTTGYTEEEGVQIGVSPLALAVSSGDTETLLETVVQPDGWVLTEADVEAQLPEGG